MFNLISVGTANKILGCPELGYCLSERIMFRLCLSGRALGMILLCLHIKTLAKRKTNIYKL